MKPDSINPTGDEADGGKSSNDNHSTDSSSKVECEEAGGSNCVSVQISRPIKSKLSKKKEKREEGRKKVNYNYSVSYFTWAVSDSEEDDEEEDDDDEKACRTVTLPLRALKISTIKS